MWKSPNENPRGHLDRDATRSKEDVDRRAACRDDLARILGSRRGTDVADIEPAALDTGPMEPAALDTGPTIDRAIRRG